MTRWKTHYLAALGLLVLTLASFAATWPLNATLYDDWGYFYATRPGSIVTTASYAGRPFGYTGAILASLLFPGQAQGIHVVHVLAFFVAALSLFHILYVLVPGYRWFAFLYAAVYLFYVPFNLVHIVALHMEIYSWTVAIACVGFALFAQSAVTGGRLSLALVIVAGLCGYVAVLSYESTYLVLATAPFIIWLARRKLSSRTLAASIFWWVATTVAFLQFMIPYLSEDPTTNYQRLYSPAQDLQEFALFAGNFYLQSFPARMIADYLLDLLVTPYIGITLITAAVAALTVYIFWRAYPEEHMLPPIRVLEICIIVGLLLTGLAGLPYIYATLVINRSHFISAPIEALAVTGVFGVLAWLLERFGIMRLGRSLSVFVLVYFTAGAYWLIDHQLEVNRKDADFSQRGPLFREMLGLIPDVEEGTLIIYDCERHDNRIYISRDADVYGVRYLYQDRANFRTVSYVDFGDVNLRILGIYGDLLGALAHEYRYDQLIILRCTPEGLTLLSNFPEEWKPGITEYDPYDRIVPGFIKPWQARILAR